MHCCHPPSPFPPWFLNAFLVIYIQKFIATHSKKCKGSSYFNPTHFNQQTWLQPSPTRALFSLSSVCPRLALASCGLRALGKSVENRTHPVSSRATLAQDSRQMHSARKYSRHKTMVDNFYKDWLAVSIMYSDGIFRYFQISGSEWLLLQSNPYFLFVTWLLRLLLCLWLPNVSVTHLSGIWFGQSIHFRFPPVSVNPQIWYP